MNKTYHLFALSVLLNITVYCQDIQLIKIDSLYAECGVVFPASYDLSIEVENLRTRFTPPIEEIAKAEKIFLTQFKHLDHSKSKFPNGSAIPNFQDYFKKFIRQYIGYVDEEGNRNILIHLINNEHPRKVKKVIGANWKKDFILILAQPMPFDILTYRIDLSKKKLNINF